MSTTPDDLARTQAVPNLELNETRLLGLAEVPRTSADEPPPTVLGDFTLGPKLGEGAMGAVYRVVRGRTGQAVTVKVRPRRLTAVPGFVPRFDREVRAMGRLVHPNIVRILPVCPHREGPP